MITIPDSRINNTLPAPIPTCLNSEPKFLQECIWSNTWVLKVPLFHPLCIRKHIREREFCEAAHGKTQFTLFFSRASCPQFIFFHYFKFHFCPLWISIPMWVWGFLLHFILTCLLVQVIPVFILPCLTVWSCSSLHMPVILIFKKFHSSLCELTSHMNSGIGLNSSKLVSV